jgi:hypothetical protein
MTEAMMAGQADWVKRYVVKLSQEERRQLEGLLRKGKSPAQRLLKARILSWFNPQANAREDLLAR